jgi:hypothetical protein
VIITGRFIGQALYVFQSPSDEQEPIQALRYDRAWDRS